MYHHLVIYIHHLLYYPPMCCLLIPKNMSEDRRMRRNIRSNEQKKKRRLSMSRRDEVNCDLVSLSVNGSHKELGKHKVFFFTPPKINCWFNCNLQIWFFFNWYQWRQRSKLPTEYHWWWKKWWNWRSKWAS